MRRKTLYRCRLVLFAVMLFLQGWGMVLGRWFEDMFDFKELSRNNLL